MSSAQHAFLLKTFDKFQKTPQKRTHIIQETLLPWLRNNRSKSPNNHLQKTNSSSDPVKKRKSNTLTRLFRSRKTVTSSKEHPPSCNLEFIRVLLGWWNTLIDFVEFQHYSQRTVYFDCIVEIISRDEFLRYDHWLGSDRTCETNSTNYGLVTEYEELLNSTLACALESANSNTVYPGTSIFCAHVLAICFFKVPQLANCLLQSLPFVRPRTISKISKELLCSSILSEVQPKLLQGMPDHLHPLMMMHTMDKRQRGTIVPPPFKLGDHFLSRWKTSDRAFFILFYQRYHIHLQTYIHAAIPDMLSLPLATKNTILALSPGYIHLAAYMTDKIAALIQSDPALSGESSGVTTTQLRAGEREATATAAVATGSTTATPCNSDPRPKLVDQQRCSSPSVLLDVTRDSGDSAAVDPYPALRADRPKYPRIAKLQQAHTDSYQSGKPRVLDAATRRYAYCFVSCAMTACDTDGALGSMTAMSLLYQDMLNVWIRVVARYISCSTPASVFCLIDFIENLICELTKKPAILDPLVSSSDCLDNPFILHVLHIALSRTDNTIVHQRILAFIYSHFGFLTQQRPELLRMLCSRILLDPATFERFLTHWHEGVRVSYIQLLFARIRPLWSQAPVLWTNKPPSSVTTKNECDGKTCRNVWRGDHQGRHIINSQWTLTHGSRADDGEYWRSTLEIHIVLETLLTAFYRQHSRLQSILQPITDVRERHLMMAKLSSKDCLPSPASDLWPCLGHSHNSAFSLYSPPPTPPPHLDDEKSVAYGPPSHLSAPARSSKKQQQRLSCKYSTGLTRVFSIRTSSSSTPDLAQQTESKTQRQHRPQSQHRPPSIHRAPRYYYEVPEMYKLSSSQSCYSLHRRSTGTVERSDRSITSEEGDSAYASGTTTPTKMDMANPFCVPDTVSIAEAWKYPASTYLYAARAVDEMDQVGALTRLPSSISTDWPRAWMSTC